VYPISGECDIVTRADGMSMTPGTVPLATGMLAFQLTIDAGSAGIKR
jgi:hypothetical protein